jgi:transposase
MGHIAPKRNRQEPICFSLYQYRARYLVERFFNQIKRCRRIATRYDKLAADDLALSHSHPSASGYALRIPRRGPVRPDPVMLQS